MAFTAIPILFLTPSFSIIFFLWVSTVLLLIERTSPISELDFWSKMFLIISFSLFVNLYMVSVKTSTGLVNLYLNEKLSEVSNISLIKRFFDFKDE